MRPWFILLVAALGCATTRPPSGPRCLPGQACWPTAAEWQALAARLTGQLLQPRSPLEPCRLDGASPACASALAGLKNPFYIEDQPGGTQSLGWLDAWTAAPSAYAVAATSAADIVAAVKFARRHHLRVVIKGTGHDYLGRSNAADSLLIWTHQLRRITVEDAFVPSGCTGATPAVTIEAGARWLEAYQEVTVKHGRYVQGGGCTSVGAAGGFILGGGFGSWSKRYGTGAAGLLEAEVVTADGQLRVANACQNRDLYWALRGGGGGTFGVVTKMTLRTHELPNYFGLMAGAVKATSDAAFRELLARFVDFYSHHLNNANWGEQVKVRSDNSLTLGMVFAGLSAKEAARVWEPFRAFIEAHPERFSMQVDYIEIPGNRMWDSTFIKEHAAAAATVDDRPGQPAGQYYWATNQAEVSTLWHAYQSRWLPLALFEDPRLAEALFAASRRWSLELHFNKGQAGAAPEAIARGRETSMNPAVFGAAALVIAAATGDGVTPDLERAKSERARVSAAMKTLRDLTPGAGTYVNEADYFEADWQAALWGENYPKLLAIKRKYDPEGLFTCHHCVGSELVP